VPFLKDKFFEQH